MDYDIVNANIFYCQRTCDALLAFSQSFGYIVYNPINPLELNSFPLELVLRLTRTWTYLKSILSISHNIQSGRRTNRRRKTLAPIFHHLLRKLDLRWRKIKIKTIYTQLQVVMQNVIQFKWCVCCERHGMTNFPIQLFNIFAQWLQ